ncbi:MAG TPA: hypothetical protein VES88_08790 [Gemmatimonadaceae bacterium]|nr:hypothetical protein [Gemmatimonadaceae bacterium]
MGRSRTWIALMLVWSAISNHGTALGLATSPTFGEVWNNLKHEAFPILWPVLIREFSSLVGPMNDVAFRILGFCMGLAIVAALWFNARTFRHALPLFSLALPAMNPSLIVWGDSVRADGLGITLVLFAGAFIWRFVEDPTPTRFAAAAVASIVSVHTLFYNSDLLLAFCAGAVAVCALNRAWKKPQWWCCWVVWLPLRSCPMPRG